MRTTKTMDGNMAAAHVSYAFTETAGIYPITPSSDMAQHTDEWAASGKKNIFGEPVKIVEMQSEGGAAGVVHGSLQAGALTTTYTASQGLLLMIPNMYKIAGELLPGVFHVSARNIATHALSIFGEHSDIYAARQTGVAIIAAGSVQEVMDLGAVAHLSAIKGRIPFIHFFDGFRTSHEIQKIEVWDYEDLADLLDREALAGFRSRALNPDNAVTRGTNQNSDIYFQARESVNSFYNALPDIVETYMREITIKTGRPYAPFVYYGAVDAENVIIAMGSVTTTIKETIDYLMDKGEKVGVIIVHLFRPFSTKHLLSVLPESVKKIATLDRTKECGALGEPLYLDVRTALYDKKQSPIVVGGRYGLSSKDTGPSQILSVFDNLKKKNPKNQFTIGIVDDVTYSSLETKNNIDTVPTGTIECKFYGFGSDGTVGANKNAIKIIGDNSNLFVQAYFDYDSKKSGSVTQSHLRFGQEKIMSSYLVRNPNFISCSVPSFLGKFEMLDGIKEEGIFLLNSIWDKNEVINQIPESMKKIMAEKNIRFYIINATKLASEIGMGNRTNTIMQSAFFKLTQVIEFKKAVNLMKKAVINSYSQKGEDIVNMNFKLIDKGGSELIEVKVDPLWKNLDPTKRKKHNSTKSSRNTGLSSFLENIAEPINKLKGNDLPVSAFSDYPDGTFPAGTTQFEKRGIASEVPVWKSEFCIQCNQCSYVCPHGSLRPFLLNADELQKNNKLKTIDARGKGLEGLQYRLQVSPLDCTGCGSCVQTCPASKGKALLMKPLESQQNEILNWDFCESNISYKELIPKSTVKGSQFAQPLFEFSGACAGCGETPYIKVLTQLFGDRMMVANATGCSSIYGGAAPSTPYRKNAEGKGVAWANSLFEDNAEYGAGMQMATEKIRERIKRRMIEEMENVSPDLKKIFDKWILFYDNPEESKKIAPEIIALLEKHGGETAEEFLELKQYLVKKSVWIIGGDGWAYDIGFGGLDHVLASGENVNVLVLDTELYSNTGGQSSKATPTASVARFAASGKKTKKKDLGRMAMTYGYVYVAQIAMGASQSQTLKVLQEAEAYNGPSLIIAYAPCINHGIKNNGLKNAQLEQKNAVDAGYWHLYRYNPLIGEKGGNPFKLESGTPDFSKYRDFLNGEIRYTTLEKTFPDEAGILFDQSLKDAKWRYSQYKHLDKMDF